jgi:hypothetical protein
MIFNNNTCNKVIPFAEYSTVNDLLILINEYIDNKKFEKKHYTLYENTNSVIKFSIKKYDYMSTGLKGNYDDFYEYTDAFNKTYIISRNEDKLKGFCGYINRLINW